MAQYVYTMRGVGKTVPPKRAILKDISLSFFPGAKIGVLGLNGSGKSSLLRIMAGEDTSFDGEAEPMPNMRIGFLPQEPELDPDKSVRETVEEGLGEIAEAKLLRGRTTKEKIEVDQAPSIPSGLSPIRFPIRFPSPENMRESRQAQ